MTKYDVVVVGAGLAGLTAAAVLAQARKKVLLLEQASHAGGRARTQYEHGFHLNLGPHAWIPAGPGTAILRRLGIELSGSSPNLRGGFALRDGRLHTLPEGFFSLVTTDLLRPRGKLEYARLMSELRFMNTAKVDSVTVVDWLAGHVEDRDVAAVIEMLIRLVTYADAPHLMSAGVALRALQEAVTGQVLYLHGGWQVLVETLIAQVKALGVEVRLSSPVDRVDPDGKTILAVDPGTMRRLLGVECAPVAAKTACLDVCLRRLPNPHGIAVFGVGQPFYCVVHSATARLAPEGGAMIHVAKYLSPGGPHDAVAIEKELEGVLSLLQPNWQDEVVFRRYLPSMVATHAIPTLAGRTPVRVPGMLNVFLAGDWVGSRGTLGNAAVASGEEAARYVLESR